MNIIQLNKIKVKRSRIWRHFMLTSFHIDANLQANSEREKKMVFKWTIVIISLVNFREMNVTQSGIQFFPAAGTVRK